MRANWFIRKPIEDTTLKLAIQLGFICHPIEEVLGDAFLTLLKIINVKMEGTDNWINCVDGVALSQQKH